MKCHYKNFAAVLFQLLFATGLSVAQPAQKMQEKHRPQIHFSPEKNWINDPNGMVYSNGIYHLFYQYYPDKPVWGPMHWGHATSSDLVHWKEQPIALYPDSLGMIFSGSAVVDENNTSGFGKNGKAPLVAIFTHHDDKAAPGRNDFQYQSLAYSVDEGKTWTKYAGNPVLKNPGIVDFRDPKVIWYTPQKKWIMTLATKDYITFYSSPDLKNWKKESEFGKEIGAHGGVWECPDLFPLNHNGKEVWVLIVNLNPGGPNKGSATQYFTGDFDGTTFSPSSTGTKWLDYGPDEYAGITWSNTGNRKVFIGWMSNWLYANLVPTTAWRNALTIPRELTLKNAGNELLIASEPVKELASIETKPVTLQSLTIEGKLDLASRIQHLKLPCKIDLSANAGKSFSILLSNDAGEKVEIGYDKTNNQYFIDRTRSGITSLQEDFAAKSVAPRFVENKKLRFSLWIDVSSVELFADDGLTVMTAIYFPNKPYDRIHLAATETMVIDKLDYAELKTIWK
jgi:fructan beta-fructosidase